MKKISVLNYGCGNLLSIGRSIKEVGYDVKIIENQEEIEKAEFLVLPGVGAFKNAMDLLKNKNLTESVKNYALIKKKPILGICLGMQLLLTKSFEMGEHLGLDLIKGKNVLIKTDIRNIKFKVPHIDWEEVRLYNNTLSKNSILKNLNGKSFYFVHSYMASLENLDNLIALCQYHDVKIPAIIQSDNIIGCQFHPEKSGINGLNLLKNAFTIL
mgnify:CR=1 FL=1